MRCRCSISLVVFESYYNKSTFNVTDKYSKLPIGFAISILYFTSILCLFYLNKLYM